MKLYEISEEFLNLYQIPLDILENESPEDSENWKAFESLLQELEGMLELKSEQIIYIIKNLQIERDLLESQIQVFREEIKTLQKKQTAREHAVSRIKEYMLYELQRIGKDKIKAGSFTCWKQKGQPTLSIVDIDKIPSTFLKHEPRVSEIKKALQDGESIPGVELLEGKAFLQIR